MEKGKIKLLFEEFNPIGQKEWFDFLQREIKDSTLLEAKCFDDLQLNPIYTPQDLEKIVNKELYQHNNSTIPPRWHLVEPIVISGAVKETNKKVLIALEGGADGIEFFVNERDIDFDVLLENVWIDNCIVSFSCKDSFLSVIESFLSYYQELGYKREDLRGWINYDPLEQWLATGEKAKNFEGKLKELFDVTSGYPYFKCLTINSHVYANGGGTVIQELAFTLSAWVEYLEALKNKGIGPQQVFDKVKFSLTVGINYFFEISKLRAFRVLCCKIATAYEVALHPSDIDIHSQTSIWNKSNLDWENNIIRDTSEAMAAILGGCNSLTFTSLKSVDYLETSSIRRTGRNISHILREEAFLDKVYDPSAGSYYIESLTKQIADKSWELFLEIEREGGFAEAVKKGLISSSINKANESKINDIDLRKNLKIGVNVFPDLKSPKLSSLTSVKELSGGEGLIKEQMAAEGIEELRRWVETTFMKEHGVRPKVLVLNQKQERVEKSKADFIRNLFNCAGFLVEFKIDLESWFNKESKDDREKYAFILCYLDEDAFLETQYPFFEKFVSGFPVILTSSERKTINIGFADIYQPLNLLALHQNLRGILSNINQKKK